MKFNTQLSNSLSTKNLLTFQLLYYITSRTFKIKIYKALNIHIFTFFQYDFYKSWLNINVDDCA